MALLPFTKLFSVASSAKGCIFTTVQRTLVSKQLVYTHFGDPLQVVKIRECVVPPLGKLDVLVRMLAAPVNPADINTIQGKHIYLPSLPTVPGDEGVGDVVEIGHKVCKFIVGDRVVVTKRMLGTWRYYGIYNEADVTKISTRLPLPEAAMITISPCTAYRLLTDFRKIHPGQTVVQNAANSPTGQCIVQLCKAWGLKSINIVSNHCGYDSVKDYLLNIGATTVLTLEEAEELTCFDTSLSRPVLALNCLGGRFEDVMLKLLERNGSIVYYGSAHDLPLAKQFLRCDAKFHKFHYGEWSARANQVDKCYMLNNIVELMVVGKVRAPVYTALELKDYVYAFRHTVHSDAFTTKNFVFDMTLH